MSKLASLKVISSLMVFGSLCVLGCAPAHFGTMAPPANYYPLAVGDHWTYAFVPGAKQFEADITEKKSINGVTTYAMAIDQEYSYMAALSTGIYQVAQGDPEQPTNAEVFSPPQLIYKLPFVVGDSWNTPVLLEPSKPGSLHVQLYGEVRSFDTIRVPAGTFEHCVHVLIDDPRDSPSDVTELWFAPNVGIVKTRTFLQRTGGLSAKVYDTVLVSYRILP